MRIRYTVEYDPIVWGTLGDREKYEWMREVEDAITEHAYIEYFQVIEEEEVQR